ncbi:MAG: hypothetical protein ACKPKO_47865, partial [Candidatus Fonsibacter sp.]
MNGSVCGIYGVTDNSFGSGLPKNSGYVINYSFTPGRVSRLCYGDPMTITPLPANIRLIYKIIARYTNTSYFRECTYEEVR